MTHRLKSIALAAGALLAIAGAGKTALAQGYYDRGPPPGYGGQQQQYSPREARCRELEQALAGEWMRGQSGQDQLPRIDAEIQEVDRAYRRAEYDAERANCYEDSLFFGRSLRRTPKCIELNRTVQEGKRRLTQLREQRDAITRSRAGRQRQDDLIAELARNRCGENYERQFAAQRRRDSFFSLWEDEDSGPRDSYSGAGRPEDAPFATYRTMCVRTCDGYYFPISYSTLQSKLREDEAKCKSQCSAPAELFVYRNPGEDVEQMVNLEGRPYADMPYAFRNRKQFIKGCSCNASEFSREQIAASEQALRDEAEARRTAAAKPKPEDEPSEAPTPPPSPR